MGTKNNPGTFDCYASAMPNEPMFILIGRDPDAPHLVRAWAHRRSARPGETTAAKVEEALTCADDMERFLRRTFSAPGRTNDFRRLERKLFLVATDLDSGAAVEFGAPGSGRRNAVRRGHHRANTDEQSTRCHVPEVHHVAQRGHRGKNPCSSAEDRHRVPVLWSSDAVHQRARPPDL